MQVSVMTDQQARGHLADATDELSLVRDAQLGSQRAFETLYREHVGRIYALCLRLTGNVADADDSTQNTFIRAWQKLGSFRGSSAFGTWLYRIAVNESLSRQRQSAVQQPYLYLVESSTQHTASKEVQIDELEKAIMGLPDRARQVFVLMAVYGFSHPEVARMLGIATGTSKAQFHRARKLLAERLDGESIATARNRDDP
jgi:RNA polymerase sigma-70 factor (ECF subfamily)